MIDKNSKRHRIILHFALSFCILIFTFYIFTVQKTNAAVLYFSPSSGNFSVGNILTVNVMVNTEGVAVNNAEAVINFPSGLLEVVSFSKSGSIFSLWVEEPTFSNSAGTLVFNGGLPTPGFNGANGKILSAVFRVKRSGSATVAFTSPAVRANDGYGTDVFRTGSQALYNLIAIEKEKPLLTPTPVVTPKPVLVPTTLNISSPTHPDPSRWYSNNNPLFKWDVPSGVSEVLLVMSRNAGTVPFVRYSPPISERLLEDLDEGVWYLNVRFRTAAGLGPVASFRFNIDTTPPRPLSITRLDIDDPTNPRPELLFESNDETSGIDHYEIKIGNSEWLKVESGLTGKTYVMPLQKYGAYPVEVKAFDRAKNSTSAKLDIRIEPIKAPVIEEVTKEVKKGEILMVKGIAEPGTKVIVQAIRNNAEFMEFIPEAQAKSIVKIDDNHYTTTTTTTTTGDWSVEMEDLPSGWYKILAKAQDDRLALSELSNSVETRVRRGIIDLISDLFDSLINFVSNGLLLIIIGAAMLALIMVLVRKVIPYFAMEISRFMHIAREYNLDKNLKKKHGKIQFEAKVLYDDLRKELDLLKKIEKHRNLSSDEKYLKGKIEKYLELTKSLK